jgi:uncharacterized membrane protein
MLVLILRGVLQRTAKYDVKLLAICLYNVRQIAAHGGYYCITGGFLQVENYAKKLQKSSRSGAEGQRARRLLFVNCVSSPVIGLIRNQYLYGRSVIVSHNYFTACMAKDHTAVYGVD